MTDVSARDGPTLFLEPALSWSAIIAGAVVALAVSVFLTVLASGFGYDLAASGIASQRSLDAFTPELGAGAIAIQVISAGLGGYLAGRLRHLWLSAHTDEAHFRDTAHGVVVWALATVAGVLLVTAVLAPYAEHLTPQVAAATTPPDPIRAAHIAAQSAFFTAVGMILSAFTAAVAARVGGLRSEDMHVRPRI
jgi:hypothetical protein